MFLHNVILIDQCKLITDISLTILKHIKDINSFSHYEIRKLQFLEFIS
jgi:predicted MarR family transcription regulator